MIEERDNLRSSMNQKYEELPQWLKNPFSAVRDTISVLFDIGEDQMAYDLLYSLPEPLNLTSDQLIIFNLVKTELLNSINNLIELKQSEDPLKSELALTVLREAEERRRLQ